MTHVLVPLAVLDGESVSPGLVNLLGPVDVTVLGYHVLPEQTPADQARLQFEDRATAALDDLVEEFRAAGSEADHRLVFTHDRDQTVDRIADEVGADALAVPGPTGGVDRLLVSLTGDVAVDRVTDFGTALVGDRDIAVTLFVATHDPEAGAERVERAAEQFREAGIEATTRVAGEGASLDALVDAAADHDAVVMGEAGPSLGSLVLGDEADRVAAGSVGPVLVVRRERADGAD